VTPGTAFSIESGAGGTWSANTYQSEKEGVWTVTANYNGKTDTSVLTVTPTQGDEDGGDEGSDNSGDDTSDNGGQDSGSSDGGTYGRGGGGGVVVGTGTPPLPEASPEPTEYFTVDFMGRITTAPMASDGRIEEDIVAGDPGDNHSLQIPRGTRVTGPEGSVIKLIEIRETPVPPLPDKAIVLGMAYDFGPSDITLSNTVQITLSYPVTSLPSGAGPVTMAFFTETGWQNMPSQVDLNGERGVVNAPSDHFSVFAILAGAPLTAEPALHNPAATTPAVSAVLMPATFVLSDLQIETSYERTWSWLPLFAAGGKDAVVSVNVQNVGEQSGMEQVVLIVNGGDVDMRDLNFTAGQSDKLVFSLGDNAPGLYVVEVGELTATFESYTRLNWWTITGLLIGSGILALLTWFLNNRRRKIGQSSGGTVEINS